MNRPPHGGPVPTLGPRRLLSVPGALGKARHDLPPGRVDSSHPFSIALWYSASGTDGALTKPHPPRCFEPRATDRGHHRLAAEGARARLSHSSNSTGGVTSAAVASGEGHPTTVTAVPTPTETPTAEWAVVETPTAVAAETFTMPKLVDETLQLAQDILQKEQRFVLDQKAASDSTASRSTTRTGRSAMRAPQGGKEGRRRRRRHPVIGQALQGLPVTAG